MKTRVVITNMSNSSEIMHDFATQWQANEYFKNWCDEHDYPYNDDSEESGGIGYDFRIEIRSNDN